MVSKLTQFRLLTGLQWLVKMQATLDSVWWGFSSRNDVKKIAESTVTVTWFGNTSAFWSCYLQSFAIALICEKWPALSNFFMAYPFFAYLSLCITCAFLLPYSSVLQSCLQYSCMLNKNTNNFRCISWRWFSQGHSLLAAETRFIAIGGGWRHRHRQHILLRLISLNFTSRKLVWAISDYRVHLRPGTTSLLWLNAGFMASRQQCGLLRIII